MCVYFLMQIESCMKIKMSNIVQPWWCWLPEALENIVKHVTVCPLHGLLERYMLIYYGRVLHNITYTGWQYGTRSSVHFWTINSIYQGNIWYNSVRSSTITMVRLRSGLHSQTTPHTLPLRWNHEVSFMSYAKKNDRYIDALYIVIFVSHCVADCSFVDAVVHYN